MPIKEASGASRRRKRRVKKPGNVERLVKAGVVPKGVLSERERAIVEGLTRREVETLIRLRRKLGAAPARRQKAKPNFPL